MASSSQEQINQAVNKAVAQLSKMPFAQKVAIPVAIIALITAGTYYMYIMDAQATNEASLTALGAKQTQLFDASTKAQNIDVQRRKKQLLDQQLAQALTELPEETNIPELLQSFYELSTKSGVTINSFSPGLETKSVFYSELNLALAVTGNYHEIAVFFDSLSKIKRIVKVSAVKMTNPRIKNEKELLDATFTATTYRFLPVAKVEGVKK